MLPDTTWSVSEPEIIVRNLTIDMGSVEAKKLTPMSALSLLI
jgi:hypothetical protein